MPAIHSSAARALLRAHIESAQVHLPGNSSPPGWSLPEASRPTVRWVEKTRPAREAA